MISFFFSWRDVVVNGVPGACSLYSTALSGRQGRLPSTVTGADTTSHQSGSRTREQRAQSASSCTSPCTYHAVEKGRPVDYFQYVWHPVKISRCRQQRAADTGVLQIKDVKYSREPSIASMELVPEALHMFSESLHHGHLLSQSSAHTVCNSNQQTPGAMLCPVSSA